MTDKIQPLKPQQVPMIEELLHLSKDISGIRRQLHGHGMAIKEISDIMDQQHE